MPSKKSYLNQSDVAKILAAADAHAQKNNWEVSISVVDDGGHLLGFVRRDNAPPISTYISQEKAKAAALGKRESKVYEDVINNGRFSFINATAMLHGTLEGGVNIVMDGQTIGAVGVSGVKSNEDAEIAKAGIAAIGL
ncbi:MAG: heme-binding protein [Burkholderiaceae bacterium]|jgi:uncharacterized protein GlcG (DUF336 family)|uniref:GlcG/HbpS family heme-binding protein n=1 Tax=Polynucleobacter sp. MWH-Loch1C5 TaxID=2689108 RepID=UPI001C0D1894|nr:heme-binding protein [Polynucleobacter sp. MWH-Loch1C5]MBU3542137.1 heme-binding protein [Polynucleobacter sp. MWH-Loch1C5]NBV00989.1 heme-binding protein [Burkholderiaceae bacterium]